MRAAEFIAETRKIRKPTKRQQNASIGMSKFRDPGGYDRTYELNRIMMATACSDGVTPLKIDAESWSGRYNTAHPYTKEERDMLKQAYDAVGSESEDFNGDDLLSQEMPNTNTTSPVNGFKGWGVRK
jgi:hypothetical protein